MQDSREARIRAFESAGLLSSMVEGIEEVQEIVLAKKEEKQRSIAETEIIWKTGKVKASDGKESERGKERKTTEYEENMYTVWERI